MKITLTIIAVLLAAAGQAALPTVWWLGGLRLELLPALVAWAALFHRRPATALAFALLAGCAHDTLSAAPFGLSAFAYSFATAILLILRRTLDPEWPWVQLLAGGLVSACASVTAIAAIPDPAGGPLKLLALAGSSALVTLALCFAVELARLFHREVA